MPLPHVEVCCNEQHLDLSDTMEKHMRADTQLLGKVCKG